MIYRKFEYETISLPDNKKDMAEVLNELGLDGWEMVAILPPPPGSVIRVGVGYFKREIVAGA